MCVKLVFQIKGKTGSESLRIGWYGRYVGCVDRCDWNLEKSAQWRSPRTVVYSTPNV